MIRFDEVLHTYWAGDREVPGVTRILTEAGMRRVLAVDDETMEHARQRGKAVHRACELLSLDALDEATVDPEVAPYLDAFRKFSAECHPNNIDVERLVHSQAWNYCGTLDRIDWIAGQRTLVDIKTGSSVDWAYAAVQTAAYAQAWNEENSPSIIARTACLQLRADGEYRLRILSEEYPTAKTTWQSVMICRNWREKYVK